jgi:hypothetical protein
MNILSFSGYRPAFDNSASQVAKPAFPRFGEEESADYDALIAEIKDEFVSGSQRDRHNPPHPVLVDEPEPGKVSKMSNKTKQKAVRTNKGKVEK